MSEIEVVLSRLSNVKSVAGGYQARCPCHDDKVASLSIAEKEGKLLAYCHAGCKFEDIIKALNLPPPEPVSTSFISATYDYTDKDGKLLYQVVRYQPKAFKQRRPDGQGGWIWDLKGITPTLYHLPEIATAQMVWVVEGEKDVDNLRKQGQTATSISGGASSKWATHLPLHFLRKDVAVIPDFDEPGKNYANYVANLLYGIAKSVKIVNLSLGASSYAKDVSEYFKTNPIADLLDLYRESKIYAPTGIVTREEFNELRSLNLYLLRVLMTKKKGSKYTYDSVEILNDTTVI